MFLRSLTFISSIIGSFGFTFSSSEFYTSYVQWMQKKMRGIYPLWTDEQIADAEELAGHINPIARQGLLDEFDKADFIEAINRRDFGGVEKILRQLEAGTLQPWYIVISLFFELLLL